MAGIAGENLMMAWVTIDDQTPRHQKHLRVGAAASWLWVCGLAHCNSQLTNGFIPDGALTMLGAFTLAELKRLPARLCEANLWEKVEGGYRVHDYLEYQPSRETVLDRMQRRKQQAQVAAHTRWSKQHAAEHAAEHAVSNADEHAAEQCVGMGKIMPPTQPLVHTLQTPTKSLELVTPVPAPEPDKSKAKGHRSHFFCGDRFCVPQFLWEEFDRQLGGADMVKAKRWMEELDRRAFESGEIIEDEIAYVRLAFRAALKGQKRHGYMDARTDDILDTCPHIPRCTGSRACQTLRDIEAVKEQMRHESTDTSAGRPIESAPVETGRSYSVRDSDAGGVRRA